MKSKASNTNKLTWNSSISELYKNGKLPKSIESLASAQVHRVIDLLNIFPLRAQLAPSLQKIKEARVDELFKGKAEVFNIKKQRSFSGRGKKNIPLFNITLIVKDSSDFLTLKWFNAYPNMVKKIESIEHVFFMGKVTDYKNAKQIINPTIINDDDFGNEEVLVEYPTINKISGSIIKSLIAKIPTTIWDTIPEVLPVNLLNENNLIARSTAFKALHGYNKNYLMKKSEAIQRMIYEEFFIDQAKIVARRLNNKKVITEKIIIDQEYLDQAITKLPYKLTIDQAKVIQEIKRDLASGTPMMRMLQGDVGSGKTTIAQLISLVIAKQGFQVAIMAPTETLANQHYRNLIHFFNDFNITSTNLTGSLKPKEKKERQNKIANGDFQVIIGTHALFQESVQFKNLKLAIIDEQHKFGVDQRLKLITKGNGVHSLIMSATPIPRTLQLINYGDLDISTIYSMPEGRKGTKTRIVGPENFQNFLSFVKTRLSLKEQVYVVVPAIEESELDLKNINETLLELKNYFPDVNVDTIHGQLSSEEKDNVAQKFYDKKIDILLATSVIEVGINVLNATVIAIYNPERFGLSSLHQLRGRVGRSDKPGFCFLVINENISENGIKRLKILEKTTDGFKIAEADLEFRGEGDVFGVEQSGSINNKRFANIFKNSDVLNKVSQDINTMIEHDDYRLLQLVENLEKDEKVRMTI